MYDGFGGFVTMYGQFMLWVSWSWLHWTGL